MAKTMTGTRLEDDTIARLDRIAVELGRRAAGIDVDRSAAMRAAVERGIEALEQELGLVPVKKGGAKTPRKA